MKDDGLRAHEAYLARYPAFAKERTTRDPQWLIGLREQAIGRLEETGFPSTRLEEWRYTNVAPLTRQHFELPTGDARSIDVAELEELAAPLFACSFFVFENGTYRPELSTPLTLSGDLHVRSLAQLRREAPSSLEAHLGQQAELKGHAFAALNTAFMDDGAVVQIPAGEEIDQPLHLIFVSTEAPEPIVTHPRVLVIAEENSRATLIQHYVSIGQRAHFTNSVSEVVVQPNASLDLVLLQREYDASHHISSLHVRQERDSRFSSHTISLGGRLVRNDLSVTLAAEGAETVLRGLFLGTGSGLVDNHTLVDHAVPHCTSRELYKGILGDRSRGVFRGRVIVRPDAQQTDALQSNANLLLSDSAEVDTKPQLEIYADDVKCSHGSSIGQIDADALFYLQSRGFAEPEARELLTQGFASEITQALPAPALGERAQELLRESLREMRIGNQRS